VTGRPLEGRPVGLAVNPASGSGRGRAAGAVAAARLAAAGARAVHLGGATFAELARHAQAALGELDALVVVGGDGMVHTGVNLVAGTATPLGIVPAGTGNDVARALGLPLADPAAATDLVVAALAGSAVRVVDAVRITGDGDGPSRWFAGVLGAGFDAVVNERANGWSWPRGRARYTLAVARELPVFRQRRYTVELDGTPWEVSAMLVAVANAASYGGGMRVAPDAVMDDGLLDVVVAGPISRIGFVRVFPSVFSGGHLDHPAVTVRRARRVRVSTHPDDPPVVAYADGERIAALPLLMEAVPGALHLLAPGPAG